MIYLAASRFNPEQEEGYTMGGGGAAAHADDKRLHGALRKISLTTVRLYVCLFVCCGLGLMIWR